MFFPTGLISYGVPFVVLVPKLDMRLERKRRAGLKRVPTGQREGTESHLDALVLDFWRRGWVHMCPHPM
jgi:hypothetical protein